MDDTNNEQSRERVITVPSEAVTLEGVLVVPPEARGVVLFAHGSGSGRFSPRNNFVARQLQEAGLATLLLDLLREDEAQDRRFIFDIELLAQRLRSATNWLRSESETSDLPIGYFGASTGAAAALIAAAQENANIAAVVSRGGRPDLANEFLAEVKAPTLLIVGGRDTAVLALNREALAALRCPKDLTVVPGATHLFEEPGTLEKVAELAAHWFLRYLRRQKEHAA